MSDLSFIDGRLTEGRNPRSTGIDVATAAEIVDLMHEEDTAVTGAVYNRRGEIARTIEIAAGCLSRGGRIVYVGAGTSGRLGVLDASECPPTFGSDPRTVVGVIAGGREALVRSQEGAEDDTDAACAELRELAVGENDLVIGIAASGSTPFVGAALHAARAAGCRTAVVACTAPPDALQAVCDEVITVPVGPEILAGSTRLKAGTATKMVLNMISTGAMLRRGKAYGNLMVDLKATSRKLIDRGQRIMMEVCGVDRDEAGRMIAAAEGSVKLAIVMQKRDVGREQAQLLLESAGGVVRDVIGPPPEVTE